MIVNKSLIKDPETRKAIDDLNKKLDRIESIQQLPRTASNSSIVDALNRITRSIKRTR